KAILRAAVPLGDSALMVQSGTMRLARLPLDGAGSPGWATKQPMMFDDIDVNAHAPQLSGDVWGNVCISVGTIPGSTQPSRGAVYVLRADGSRVMLPLAGWN